MRVVFQEMRRQEELNENLRFTNALQENLLQHIDQDRTDPVMRPLEDSELRKLKVEKAKPSLTEPEICSICCDEIKAKTEVRVMPECKHTFHKK